MRGDHELGRLVVRPRVLLDEARDAHALLGEYLADGGDDARPIGDPDPVVGARPHLAYRDDADAVVEAERWPALDAAADRAREVDQVADDGGRGGAAARALANQQHLADEVALDEDRVLRAFDARQGMVERNHGGVDASLDSARVPLGVRDELDGVAELTGVAEVDRLDALDAFAVDLARPHLDLVSDRGEDRKLVRRVEASEVVC